MEMNSALAYMPRKKLLADGSQEIQRIFTASRPGIHEFA